MRRVSSTDDIVKKLREDIQLKSKLIAAYQIPTPEFDKLVPDEYYAVETKRFLLLKALNCDTSTVPRYKPSKAIDDLWCIFMTCIKEYYNFCNSILSEDYSEKFIEKISYNDERNPTDGFDKTIEEYKRRFPEENLSTVLWNSRYKDKSYNDVLEMTKNSTGSVYHSPFYETGHNYTDTFRPVVGETAIQITTAVENEVEDNTPMRLVSIAAEQRSKKNSENTDSAKRPRGRPRSNSLVASSPEENGKKQIEINSSGKRGRGRPPKNSNKKLLRTEKCPKCTEAVGENNHDKKVDVYLDLDSNTEIFGGHLGACRKS